MHNLGRKETQIVSILFFFNSELFEAVLLELSNVLDMS